MIRNENFVKPSQVSEEIFTVIEDYPIIKNKISPQLRTFIAAREGFIFNGIMLEDDLEVVIKENLIFKGNFKYALYNSFDKLTLPPKNIPYPAQVRTDNKKYLNKIDQGLKIGRLELDYFASKNRKHF